MVHLVEIPNLQFRNPNLKIFFGVTKERRILNKYSISFKLNSIFLTVDLTLYLFIKTEFPLITKGGARIEVLLNATTRRDEQGNGNDQDASAGE